MSKVNPVVTEAGRGPGEAWAEAVQVEMQGKGQTTSASGQEATENLEFRNVH